MFGLRPTNLEVGYTASSALPAVLGKMVARWHKNRVVPRRNRRNGRLASGDNALRWGNPRSENIPSPQTGLDFHASFILWDNSVFCAGIRLCACIFRGAPPPPQRASLQRDESHYFRPNHVWGDLSRRRGEGEVPERGMGAWC